PQVFSIPLEGGVPRQLTFHTAGCALQEYTPDGNLLIKATRDNFWKHGERFFTVGRSARGPERLLFDDYGSDGTLSPDGKKLLFTREGEAWWRKGYTGSRAAQIWLHDRDDNSFTKVLHQQHGCRWLHAGRAGDRLHRRRRPVGHGHRAARAAANHEDCRRGKHAAVHAGRPGDPVRRSRQRQARDLAGHPPRPEAILVAEPILLLV